MRPPVLALTLEVQRESKWSWLLWPCQKPGSIPGRQILKSLAALSGHYRNSFHTMENLTPSRFLQAGTFDLPAEIRRPTVISCCYESMQNLQLKTPKINVNSILTREAILWIYMEALLNYLFKKKLISTVLRITPSSSTQLKTNSSLFSFKYELWKDFTQLQKPLPMFYLYE